MPEVLDDDLPDAATLGEPPPLDEVLDDLAMRFVVNCPAEEQETFERLLFQVEAAHWFYEDQYKEIWPKSFPSLTLYAFAQKMFETCPMLRSFAPKTQEIYNAFLSYKLSIPTCGAIILNSNNSKLVLIKSWKGTNWGFPKGKIDKDEDKLDCAIREVREEIGYDITERVRPELYVEHQWKEQKVRLYVVQGVPDDTVFQTRTKKEISEIAWHKIKDVPTTRDESSKEKTKFWMVVPFVNKMRRLLAEQKKAKGGKAPAPPPAAEAPKAAKQKGSKQPAPAPGAEPPKAASTPSTVPLGIAKSKGKKGGGAAAAAPSAAPPSSAANMQVMLRSGGEPPPRGHPFLDFRFQRQALLEAFDGGTVAGGA